MLTALEFVRQCDGKVGAYFAKRSANQNSFMNMIITDGLKPSVIDTLTVKFGQLVLPVQEYKAVGSVYHQLKTPFAEYQQDGIVGSELASGPAKSRAPRAPRAPRESAPKAAPKAASPASIAMMARHISRTAARILVIAERSQEVIEGITVPDTAILNLARNFRSAGKEALALALEADYLADAEKAESARLEVRSSELRAIMAALVEEYGADAVADAAPVPSPSK